jgi:hypothetical protein
VYGYADGWPSTVNTVLTTHAGERITDNVYSLFCSVYSLTGHRAPTSAVTHFPCSVFGSS